MLGQEAPWRMRACLEENSTIDWDVASKMKRLISSSRTQDLSIIQCVWSCRLKYHKALSPSFPPLDRKREGGTIFLINHCILGFRIMNNIEWYYFQFDGRATSSAYGQKTLPRLWNFPSPSPRLQPSCLYWENGCVMKNLSCDPCLQTVLLNLHQLRL